jgi:Predicted acyltransferases
VAVIAVLLFHANKLAGGYLGVDLFFVLSGYLITSLLLAEARSTGTVHLLGFWARRARRLLPALFLVLAFVGLYAAVIAAPSELHRIRADAFATLAYVANWRFVFGKFDYFALFASPSPLNHTWSLAIEEQFYLVWPLVFVGVLAWGRRRDRGEESTPNATARRMFWVSLVLAAASAALALGLWAASQNATRIYYGTDTRAASILLGAALGAFLAWRGPASTRRTRFAVESTAFVGVGVLAVAWSRLSGANLYRGGLLACAVAGAAVIAAAAHPRPGLVARALSFTPFVGLGVISYGLYLWHWPIYLWLNADRVGVDGWSLFAVRMAVTLPVALASFFLVEKPIRRGAFAASTLRWATPLAAAALIAITFATTAGYVPETSNSRAGISDSVDAARLARAHPGTRRLMVVGNSVAYFLAAEGFSELKTKPPLVALNTGLLSCVYPDGERLRFESFGRGRAPIPCDQGWETDVKQFDPDVVFMTFSDSGPGQLLHNGKWLAPCDPEYRDWYLHSLEGAVRTLGARGARVVMSTSAYSIVFGSTEATRDQSDCTNALTREFASSHPTVGLIDLGHYVCPARDRCHVSLGGITLRTDFVHYRGPAARLIARWLLPRLGIT